MKSLALWAAIAAVAGNDEPVDPSQYRFPSEAKTTEPTRAETPVERAYLGIWPGDEEDDAGVRVGRVQPEGPAEKAGIQAGDRILKFDGQEVTDYSFLTKLIGARRPGTTLDLVVEREGVNRTVRATLGARAGGGLFGLSIWGKPEFRLGVVLVEFPDGRHNPAFARADFARMLFSRGDYVGANPSGDRVFGSLADYYRENSGGKLTVRGRVFDWVTLDEKRAWFEEKPMGHKEGTRKLLSRAVELVQSRDGMDAFEGIDGVVFLYAGKQTYRRPWLLWPHRANVRIGERSLPYYLTAEGGKYFNALNVHVHEFGHMLGLPDQYGRNHSSGVGKGCTMAVGHMGGGASRVHRPFHLCVWCKLQLGWVKVATVRPDERQWLKLSAVEHDSATAVRILLREDGSDSLLLENRQRRGFDAELEATGLLVWRVRRGETPDLIESHGRRVSNASLVDVEEIPWPSLYNRDFTPETTPPSPPGLYLTDIVEQEGVVYFKVGVPKEARSGGLEKRREY